MLVTVHDEFVAGNVLVAAVCDHVPFKDPEHLLIVEFPVVGGGNPVFLHHDHVSRRNADAFLDVIVQGVRGNGKPREGRRGMRICRKKHCHKEKQDILFI